MATEFQDCNIQKAFDPVDYVVSAWHVYKSKEYAEIESREFSMLCDALNRLDKHKDMREREYRIFREQVEITFDAIRIALESLGSAK